MQIFDELNKNANLSLALGFFDGVHLGHQAVIKNAVDYAKQNGAKSAVVTFKDHPCCYFYDVCPKYILTREDREKKIEALGVDFLYELDFPSISGLTAKEYLQDILVKHFMPVSISTGFNHYFGYKKSGNVDFLEKNANKFGYKYFKLPPQKVDGEVISSTLIRKCLSVGEIQRANKMLGAKFSVGGQVIKGNQIGRTIGFRTANLVYPSELIELPHGVYSVDIDINADNSPVSYRGIANFGTRPTVDGKTTLVEVHILDFDEDIYGKIINVKFNKMIRKEQKFSSLDALKKQIESDIRQMN